MEELKRKQAKFLKTLQALERSLKLSDSFTNVELQTALIASDVKHFEMCYEATWKFLQVFVRVKFDLKIDSPKKIFRELFALGLIDQLTTTNLLDISESRNATVHDYDEETALETRNRIASYYVVLKTLITIDS